MTACDLDIYLQNYLTTQKHVSAHLSPPNKHSCETHCVHMCMFPGARFSERYDLWVTRSPEKHKHTGRAAAHSQAWILLWTAPKSQTHTQLCLDKSNIVIQMPAEDIWSE